MAIDNRHLDDSDDEDRRGGEADYPGYQGQQQYQDTGRWAPSDAQYHQWQEPEPDNGYSRPEEQGAFEGSGWYPIGQEGATARHRMPAAGPGSAGQDPGVMMQRFESQPDGHEPARYARFGVKGQSSKHAKDEKRGSKDKSSKDKKEKSKQKEKKKQ